MRYYREAVSRLAGHRFAFSTEFSTPSQMLGVCLRIVLCVCACWVKCCANANTLLDQFEVVNASKEFLSNKDYLDVIDDVRGLNNTKHYNLNHSTSPHNIIRLNAGTTHSVRKRHYHGRTALPYDNKQISLRYNYYIAQPGNKISEWRKRVNADRYSYINPVNSTNRIQMNYRGSLINQDKKYNEPNKIKSQQIALVTMTTKVYDYTEQETESSKEKDLNHSTNDNSDSSDYEEQILLERDSKEDRHETTEGSNHKLTKSYNNRPYVRISKLKPALRNTKKVSEADYDEDDLTLSAIKRRMTNQKKNDENDAVSNEAYQNYLKRSKNDLLPGDVKVSNETLRHNLKINLPVSETAMKNEGSHPKYIVKDNMYWKHSDKDNSNNKGSKSKEMLHPQISVNQLGKKNDNNVNRPESKMRKTYQDNEFIPQYQNQKNSIVDRSSGNAAGNLFSNKASSLFFGTAGISKPVLKTERKVDRRDFFASDATAVHYSKIIPKTNHYSYPWYAVTNKFGVNLMDGKTYEKPRIPLLNKPIYNNLQQTIKKTNDYQTRRYSEETTKSTSQRSYPLTIPYNMTKITKKGKGTEESEEEINYHTQKNTYNALLSRNSERKFTRKTLNDIESVMSKNLTDYNYVSGIMTNESIEKSRYFNYPSKTESNRHYQKNLTLDMKQKSTKLKNRQFPKHLPIFRTKSNKTKKQKHPCYMEQLNSITFTNRVLRKPVQKCDSDGEDAEKYEDTESVGEANKHILKRDETCQTADGEIGTCVNLYNCLPAMKEGILDAELMKLVYCGFDGIVPMVCCTNVNKKSSSILKIMLTPRPVPATKKRYTNDESSYALKPPFCGGSTKVKKGYNRFTGFPAELGNFPWMALLGYRTKYERLKWMCSGTLISTQHILTSAFCVRSDLYTVRLGDLDTSRADDEVSLVNVSIQQKIRHEKYNAENSANDIGLLVLSHPIQFSKLISPVCLPLLQNSQDLSFEKFMPTLVGWMHTAHTKANTHLTAIQLPVVTNKHCAYAYSKEKNITIGNNMLCAGFRKTNCLADPGAPLLQHFWNEGFPEPFYYQIGILSGRLNCENPQLPAIFTRVTHYLPWLEKHISQTHLL